MSSYKDTLNLPKTEFPMKAGLTTLEPEILARWERQKLYERIQEARKEATRTYILHDGPPFANGDVHMGTALNKILKDFVVKARTMAGYRAPYIPGWDCHGLPIEFKVVKESKTVGMAGLAVAALKYLFDLVRPMVIAWGTRYVKSRLSAGGAPQPYRRF